MSSEISLSILKLEENLSRGRTVQTIHQNIQQQMDIEVELL